MANDNKQNGVLRFIPDLPFFRRLMSKTKIKMTYKTALSQKDVIKGESSDRDKQTITSACVKKWPAAAKRINNEIDKVFETVPFFQNEEISLDKVREDMLFKYFAYGFQPNEYFAFRLDQKNSEQIREFISGRLRMKYRCQMNNILEAHFFNDKAQTYEYFKEYYHRQVIAIEKQEDLNKFLEYVDEHPVFVKKQVYLAQGNSVELIDIRKIDESRSEYFHKLIKIGKHVLEEKIEQTADMAQFNESSVNTVRAITFNTKHGFKVPYCMIRTGRPGAFVDNSGAGGVQAEIDFDTGTVISDGFDELGGKYQDHPASGTRFKGFELPDWEQLKKLIFSAASKVPQIGFIGWDLAHTKDGWVIVEGNENCYIIALQQIRDAGMRKEFEELMEDMNLYA